MLVYAVFAFAAGAVLGLVLAATVLRGMLASWTVSLIHAALGATGLVLLILGVTGGGDVGKYATWALILLLIAALGGFFLASFHARKLPAPKSVVVIHAGIAVIGFLLLAGTALHMV